MIKKLLLTAALLPPGLAYGQVSAPLDPPVIPAPAAAAGFTTPVMLNNFATVASNWPSQNIVQCGASASVSGQPSTWHFVLQGTNGAASCAHASLVTDSACGNCQALNFKYPLSDNSSPGSGPRQQEGISWPAFTNGSSTVNTWMPNAFYTKITFRFDANTMIQGGTGSWGDNSWWTTSGTCCAAISTSVDENMGETTDSSLGDGQGSGTLTNFGGGYWEWTNFGCEGSSNTCNLFGYTNATLNMSVYHTLEFLWTNNGSNSSYVCSWVDANGSYSGPGFQGCSGGSLVNSSNYSEHDRVFNIFMGAFNNDMLYNANVYIQDYEVWSCPSFATGTCAGTLVTHWPFP
jgi:hypothetical protein